MVILKDKISVKPSPLSNEIHTQWAIYAKDTVPVG